MQSTISEFNLCCIQKHIINSKTMNEYFTVNLPYWLTYVTITLLQVCFKAGVKLFGCILDGEKK